MNLKLSRALGLGVALASVFALVSAPALAGQPIIVEKNHMTRVTLASPAGSVIVGNPDIADVNVVDSHTIYILGKGFGNSAITITGRDGRPLYDAEVVVTAAQKGAITVYKGLKPSLMVCSNICIAEDPSTSNVSDASAAPVPNGMVSMAPTLSQGAASAGDAFGSAGGVSAMQVQ